MYGKQRTYLCATSRVIQYTSQHFTTFACKQKQKGELRRKKKRKTTACCPANTASPSFTWPEKKKRTYISRILQQRSELTTQFKKKKKNILRVQQQEKKTRCTMNQTKKGTREEGRAVKELRTTCKSPLFISGSYFPYH